MKHVRGVLIVMVLLLNLALVGTTKSAFKSIGIANQNLKEIKVEKSTLD